MTFSPTPAVLPDARARHTWDRFDRPRTCEVCGYVEHDGSGIGFCPCATPPESDAAVPAGEVLGPLWRKVQQVQSDAMRHDWSVEDYRAGMAATLGIAAAPKVASDSKTLRQVMASGDPEWPGGAVERDAWFAGYDAAVAERAAPKVASDTGAELREALAQAIDPEAFEPTDNYDQRISRDMRRAEAYSAADRVAALATPTDATDGATGGGASS